MYSIFDFNRQKTISFQPVTKVISVVQLNLERICFALVHPSCMPMHCNYLPLVINWFISHNSLRLPKRIWRSGPKIHRTCQFWEKAKPLQLYSTNNNTETESIHHIHSTILSFNTIESILIIFLPIQSLNQLLWVCFILEIKFIKHCIKCINRMRVCVFLNYELIFLFKCWHYRPAPPRIKCQIDVSINFHFKRLFFFANQVNGKCQKTARLSRNVFIFDSHIKLKHFLHRVYCTLANYLSK